MEERAYIGSGTQLVGSAAARPLDSLAGAVVRVNNAAARVQDFLDRFHGSKEPNTIAGSDRPEPTFPHRENIGRLFEALDRLESRLADLNAIG